MRWLVDLLYLIAAILTSPFWLWRMSRTGKLRTDWPARFGRVEPLPPKTAPRILLHAVSVGEVNAIRLLVDELRRVRCADHSEISNPEPEIPGATGQPPWADPCEPTQPGCHTSSRQGDVCEPLDAPASETPAPHLIISVTTDTGIARARELFANLPGVHVVRYPFDFSFAVNRFLNAIRPDAVGLVELELWPNFLSACTRRQIPVAVINGRLSARSFKRYRAIGALVKPMFRRLAIAAVQTPDYAERFKSLDAARGNVHITGTMKWDTAEIADHVPGADELARDLGIDRSRPLIVAGSTAPTEHELLRDALPPGAQLLCAPRKPEWFDQAAQALPNCIRRSRRVGTAHHPSPPPVGCVSDAPLTAESHTTPAPLPNASPTPLTFFLLDTIGELRKAYALADVVVIGRTFVDLHGSDMIEPIGLGKATLIGPDTANFKDVADDFLAAGALIRSTRQTLAADLARLLADPAERARLAANGRARIRAHQGATQRHAALLLNLLNRSQHSSSHLTPKE